MNGPELLAARREARSRAARAYAENARVSAARHGLSLTCQDKPVELHGTCIGLRPQKGSIPSGVHGGRINEGLGCLCPCHDAGLDTYPRIRATGDAVGGQP
jgi:hypothetical protein